MQHNMLKCRNVGAAVNDLQPFLSIHHLRCREVILKWRRLHIIPSFLGPNAPQVWIMVRPSKYSRRTRAWANCGQLVPFGKLSTREEVSEIKGMALYSCTYTCYRYNSWMDIIWPRLKKMSCHWDKAAFYARSEWALCIPILYSGLLLKGERG